MDNSNASTLSQIIAKHESTLVEEWIKEQTQSGNRTAALMKEAELRSQCMEFLGLVIKASAADPGININGPIWKETRDLLADISRTRAVQGFTPTETATFIFSLKRPLYTRMGEELKATPDDLLRENWNATKLLDSLGLYTSEAFLKAREQVIARQQEELLELSTPVVKLWDGILALPLIGTLDSARTQVVMESLLQKIVETGSEIAIIDITGVPTVDTLVAQHLIKTVTAARLMGAECIISGIRPQIAQTIVHLGVDLADVITKANLADAFVVALRKTGVSLQRAAARTSI